MIPEIRDVNICVGVNRKSKREVESCIAVRAIGEIVIGRLSRDGRDNPVRADMRHFADDVS
jgi:hypothetical protein